MNSPNTTLSKRAVDVDQITHRMVETHSAAPFQKEQPMWILMYVFSYSVSPAATNDRAEWRLLPTVVFQEFSSEERCNTAKSKLEGSLKEAGAKLRSGLEDLKSLGKADPAQIIIAFNVECVPK
jgi:hypothetical protein